MKLDDALLQIAEIRQQLAQAELFRGYRAATALASGLIALATGCLQARLIVAPGEQFERYLLLWIGAAALNASLVAWAIGTRYWSAESATPRLLTRAALEQFAPCLAAGAIATLAAAHAGGELAASLPGWWSLLFGLGLFATHRMLPPAMIFVAAGYLAWGAFGIATTDRGWPLEPWYMAAGFGLGQAASAGVLFASLERTR